MTMLNPHSCSYRCLRPECIEHQRDELRDGLLRIAKMRNADILLMCGELRAHELRTVRAVLAGLVGTVISSERA
jgi:hypothetical protein